MLKKKIEVLRIFFVALRKIQIEEKWDAKN